MEKDPYYSIGSITDLVISNSALSAINPKQGGSPQKFKEFFDNRVDEQSKGMITGSMFHLWAENPKAFKTGEANMPSDKLGKVAEAMLDTYNGLSIDEQLIIQEFPEDYLLQACRAIGWNKGWGDAPIIKNSKDVVLPYFKEVISAEGQGLIYLTKSDEEKITNCVASLKANKVANELLFYKDDFSDKEYFKEQEFYWTIVVNGVEYKMKMKLDDLEIDHERKVIKLTDIKTTSKCAYQFEDIFFDYAYDRQLFVYRLGILHNRPDISTYKMEYRNVVVETTGLFNTVVYKWHPQHIMDAGQKFFNCMDRVAVAISTKFKYSLEEYAGGGEIKVSMY